MIPLYWVVFGAAGLLLLAYFTYGRFVARQMDLRADRLTPAHEINDGVDFVPARKDFLLGQHFSAIAAAGPIVGPILAAIWFGWLPALLWILIGCIFFGAVHDFTALSGSVKHHAQSIVELVRVYIGRRGYLLFLAFVWLSLVYVITAFTDLTSSSFVDPELGGGVATASFLYLLLGLAMGFCLRFLRWSIGLATAVFLPLVLLAIAVGPSFPIVFSSIGPWTPKDLWNGTLLIYCLAASMIPVWSLLQPRGYLGGFFLYATLVVALAGLMLGKGTIQYPAFIGWVNPQGAPLFPFLFVTIACGACSGFHGIVCSGTTSKQISNEKDCRLVGYGGMLLEGLVALVALSTVMMLSKSDTLASTSPDRIYADGLSRFVSYFGIDQGFARSFALLAFTTFIYDTLDVTTRLARYIFQELTGWKSHAGQWLATGATILLPLVCVSLKIHDASGNLLPAWKVFWTIFGTSNQLLAGLTLMTLSLWLKRSGKSWWISALPMLFMLTMTLWALLGMIWPAVMGKATVSPVTAVATILLALASLLTFEALYVLSTAKESR